jgi:hypothetical protein
MIRPVPPIDPVSPQSALLGSRAADQLPRSETQFAGAGTPSL